MKKIIAVLMCLICLMVSGCSPAGNPKTDVENTENTKNTEIIKGAFGVQYEKTPLRMVNLDGELYFDSGLLSDTQEHTGVMALLPKKTAAIGEIPKESGTANFDCDDCQMITKITCDVLVDGKWIVFKKFENQVGETENLTGFPYCFYIKGRLNNAAIDTELAVLTDDEEITFSDVFEPMLSSQYLPDAPQKAISFNFVQSGEPWGISCSVKNLTNHGMTFVIEQFGGEYDGELQTGEWFQIYRRKEDEWVPEETNPLIDYAWHMVAYSIQKNDITEFDIDWKWLYGELSPGYYRLDKEIMDFVPGHEHPKEIYSVYFTIE